MLFALADRLHTTHAEIEQFTLEQIDGWLAYFNLIGDQSWQEAITLKS